MTLRGREKFDDIFSHFDTVTSVTDRLRLTPSTVLMHCIASRGKKLSSHMGEFLQRSKFQSGADLI